VGEALLSDAPDFIKENFSVKEAQYLVKGADSVRRLVRIKIADDNDLETAKTALKTAAEFLRRLSSQAQEKRMTPYALLQEQRAYDHM